MAKNKELAKSKFLEPDIKALALNYLRSKNLINDNSIIMNEFTIGSFSRRVDLVIYSDNKLIAFEIKSEADSLYRLNGQIDKYLEYFDKVIVISDSKFTSTIMTLLPESVGIWEVNCLKIKVIKRGKTKNKINNESLISMMDVTDLSKLSTKLKIKCDKNRSSLEQSLITVSNNTLREAVYLSLSRKFSKVTNSFLGETRNREISKSDLKLLSRFNIKREIMNEKINKNKVFWGNIEQHIENIERFADTSTYKK